MNLFTMRAADLMSNKICTIEPGATLREAARSMTEQGIHCLLVEPLGQGRGIGVIAGKDLIQAMATGEVSILDELCVEDAMTIPAITVQDDLCIADCLSMMCMAGVRSVPVLSGKQHVGFLSFTDIIRRVANPH